MPQTARPSALFLISQDQEPSSFSFSLARREFGQEGQDHWQQPPAVPRGAVGRALDKERVRCHALPRKRRVRVAQLSKKERKKKGKRKKEGDGYRAKTVPQMRPHAK